MFWTGHQRPASSVLSEQKVNTARNLDVLRCMRDEAYDLRQLCSADHISLNAFGAMLRRGWEKKCTLGSSVSNPTIDAWYEAALAAGAFGGKICGAGGGGFFLFIVPPEKRIAVRHALSELAEVPIDHEVHGSRVVFASGV
jgi:D-glycero-alpha-D-manno-heptose-7-phosphate kinase